MRRVVEMAVAVTLVLGVAVPAGAAQQGTARGAVVGTDAWKTDDGQVMLSVTIQGEGPWQATFSVGPGSREAYATVGLLKPGEQVVIGWTREDDRNWIREIGRQGGERPRAEGRETEGRERRERTELEERERDKRTEAQERERDKREELEKRERDKRTEAEQRERDKRTEVQERERDRRAEGGREERGDRERGEGERAERRQGTARGTVTGLDDRRGEDGKVVLMVTVAGEGDRRTTFSVGEGNREMFDRAKRLKAGDRVTIGWVSEGEQKWIREFGRTEGEREGGERRDREGGERREGERTEARDRREGERTERPERPEGEAREAAEKTDRLPKSAVEQGRSDRDWTKVTVISVVTVKPGDPRTLTVLRLDNGKPLVFKVGPDDAALYDAVGKLLPGRRALVVFVETKEGLRLHEVGRAD